MFNHTPPVISCVWQKISRLLYKSHYLSPLQHENEHLFANEIEGTFKEFETIRNS